LSALAAAGEDTIRKIRKGLKKKPNRRIGKITNQL
jgi:hypothetical protein